MDAQLFELLHGCLRECPGTWFWSAVTLLGDKRLGLVMAAAGLAQALLAGRSKRKADWPPLLIWAGLPMAMTVTHLLKRVIHRARPLGEDLSFPSGHATTAFAIAMALSIRWPHYKALWFGIAFLVALSRLALGIHWPSDVVAGAMVGVGIVFCMNRWEVQFKARKTEA